MLEMESVLWWERAVASNCFAADSAVWTAVNSAFKQPKAFFVALLSCCFASRHFCRCHACTDWWMCGTDVESPKSKNAVWDSRSRTGTTHLYRVTCECASWLISTGRTGQCNARAHPIEQLSSLSVTGCSGALTVQLSSLELLPCAHKAVHKVFLMVA